MRNAMTRTFALASATIMALGLAACGDDEGGNGAGKPGKAEYEKALQDIIAEEVPEGMGDEYGDLMTKITTCISDETYDDFSDSTVKAIVDQGADAEFADGDQEVIQEATTTCQGKLQDELMGVGGGSDEAE